MKGKWIIICLILLLGCGPKDMNDPSKRNENWCWFIDKETGKGKWIPIANETTVNNGYYTLFYSNGKIRETGKIANRKNVDTVSIYDVTGKLVKYTFLGKDSSVYYYLFDGVYKAYTSKTELCMVGIVTNHHIDSIGWNSDAVTHYMAVMDAIRPAFGDWHLCVVQWNEAMTFLNSGVSIIPKEELMKLDSAYYQSVRSAEKSIIDLYNIKVFNRGPEFVPEVLREMTFHKDFLTNQMHQVVILLNGEMGKKNSEKRRKILHDAKPSYEKSSDIFDRDNDEFRKKFEFTDEQRQFIDRKYFSTYNGKKVWAN